MKHYELTDKITVNQDDKGRWTITGDMYGCQVIEEPMYEEDIIEMVRVHCPERIPVMFPMYGFHQ